MSKRAGEAAQRLADARAGSKDALGEALEACRAYLLLVAERELDPDLRAKGGASDLVQQTFLEAQRDFGRFHGRSEDELRAWLRQVLVHNLANFARHYRRTGKRDIRREINPRGADSSRPQADAPADTKSPSARAVEGEENQALQLALARLPEDYQRVIRLRYTEEQSFEQIAQTLNRSANAVRKLWARAIERLEEELGMPP